MPLLLNQVELAMQFWGVPACPKCAGRVKLLQPTTSALYYNALRVTISGTSRAPIGQRIHSLMSENEGARTDVARDAPSLNESGLPGAGATGG